MAPPIFTSENFAEYLAAYRERVEQRRRAIESRPFEKRFSLGKPPQASKDFWDSMRSVMSGLQTQDEVLARLCQRADLRFGREFNEAARDGDADLVRAFMEEGYPFGWSDPRTGETALHAAAGSRARPVVRVLIQHWPDFLIRDRKGRLASELAYLYGEDPAMAHLLGTKERKNAIATGRDVRRIIYAYRAH